MANRIDAAVLALQPRIDGLTPANQRSLSVTCNLTPTEVVVFNETRALAQASGVLTHDESVSLYAILGPSDWRDGATLAGKVVLTKIMQELMTANRAGR